MCRGVTTTSSSMYAMRLPKHCLKLASCSGVNVPASPAHHHPISFRSCLPAFLLIIQRMPMREAGAGLITPVSLLACHPDMLQLQLV